MVQFGSKMDFLWFIQVLGFIFILKIQFLIHLIDLKQFWIGPQLLVSSGANPQDLQDTARHWSGLRVESLKIQGLFCKWASEAVSAPVSRPIQNGRITLDLGLSDSASARGR
jgi:hypothetical protein